MANNNMVDHYAVLELPMTASEQDVRKAYRRLAIRWHPDKNPHELALAEVRFKEVSEAYEVLRDPTKRRQYDSARSARGRGASSSWFSDSADSGFGDDLWDDEGWRWSHMGPSRGFRNPFDVFREFFGDTDPWADMSTRRQAPRQTAGGFWSSMDNGPFFSTPFFSSPFFSTRHRGGSITEQQGNRRSEPPTSTSRQSTNRVTEIKIHGFSDSEEENEEIVTVEEEEDEDNEVTATQEQDDADLREAIRLSMLQEEARKREIEQSEQDLEEAIRLSLAEQQSGGIPAECRMEVDNQAH